MDIWQIQTECDSYANVISINNILGMEHSQPTQPNCSHSIDTEKYTVLVQIYHERAIFYITPPLLLLINVSLPSHEIYPLKVPNSVHCVIVFYWCSFN